MSIYIHLVTTIILFFISHTLLEAQLRNEIDKLVSKLPKTSTAALFIYNPENGDTLYQKNIHTPYIPASNIKLITTSAALSILGGGYELSTKIFTNDTNIQDSIINGDLYLKGFGNAKFSGNDIEIIVDTLKQFGIKEITGDIITDDSFFETNFSYGTVYIDGQSNLTVPPVSALALDRNTIFLNLINRNTTGQKLDYRFFPTYPFIKLSMDARVTRFKSEPRVSYRFDGEIIQIRVLGGMQIKQKQSSYLLYIENPPLYCGLALQSKLRKAGIKLTGKLREGITPPDVQEVTSAKFLVRELLPEINKMSDNFFAESLFKSIGAEYSKDVGNEHYASEAIMNFLAENDISVSGITISDGSGISRSNRVTANSMVRLLETVYKDSTNFETFYNSLSIAGVDGTLMNRFVGTDVENNFRGKTGTIYGVSTISGYLTTEEGKTIIISILMSFSEYGAEYHREIQDMIIKLVAENNKAYSKTN